MFRSKPKFVAVDDESDISSKSEDGIGLSLAKLSTKLSFFVKDFVVDDLRKQIFHKIEYSKQNVFIHGEAGSGKSSFIQYLKEHSRKRIRIICPTAIAALNIGGVTIHSLFQLPFSDFIILDDLAKVKRTKLASILKRTDVLVIDEISMVRPDVLDAIDYLSKIARENVYEPFGGLQLVLVGDLCQLPPIIKSNTYEIFQNEYGYRNAYFFDSHVYKRANFIKFEFNKVYRQSDESLLKYLSDIRLGKNLDDALSYFNSSKILDKEVLNTALTITPYRQIADTINQNRLNALNTELINYECETKGVFDELKDTPAPRTLGLKEGSLVIFNKNNGDQWINGTSGIVEGLGENIVKVRLLNGNRIVYVKREEWKNFSYELNRETNEVIEKETGSFVQFPLQLGYALTIHKAQGKTLDKVIIDLSKGAFDHGQIYVALSRTRSKFDMHIVNSISIKDVIVDDRVLDFLSEKQDEKNT